MATELEEWVSQTPPKRGCQTCALHKDLLGDIREYVDGVKSGEIKIELVPFLGYLVPRGYKLGRTALVNHIKACCK